MNTARISSFESVMFVDRNKRDSKFLAHKEIEKDVFVGCSFFISIPSSKLTISLISIYKY